MISRTRATQFGRMFVSGLLLTGIHPAVAGASATDPCAPAREVAAQVPEIVSTDSTIAATPTVLNGRPTIQLSIPEGGSTRGGVALTPFLIGDGTIEVDLLSRLAPDGPTDSRGFAGVAFRAAADRSSYEAMYLRPTNARSEDQLRRNHSTQYISYPDYPWHRLRRESPGKYESYVDLELGVWTRMRVEVSGNEALLFVDGADQPSLIVTDLKLGSERQGQVGLWIGSGTVAHFANLRVTSCR